MDADSLPLSHLLPLRSAVVTLRLLEDSAPAFFHQPALGAFLRFLAGSPEGFERHIRFDAPESGRVNYRAGDFYRFTLVCLAGGEPVLQTVLRNLARLPGSNPKTARPLPFRDNCILAALHDAFSARPVSGFDELGAYAFGTLRQEAELWRGHGRLAWQFLSPARLLKDKVRRGEAKGEARYCRNRADVDGGLLASRLYDSLAELLRARGVATPPRPPAPALSLAEGHLFWVDAAYTDGEGASHTMGGMGGMSGRLDLAFAEPPPAEWLRQAILGQYTGVGQRAGFGFGRLPAGIAGRRVFLPPGLTPAASLLVRARDEGNLAEAWRHVRAKRGIHGAQGSPLSPAMANLMLDDFDSDMAVDVAGHKAETQGKPEIPPNSWLARLGGRVPRMVEGLDSAGGRIPRTQLPERFNSPLSVYGEDLPLTPVRHIHRQNLSLIRWLNQGEAFQAFRTR